MALARRICTLHINIKMGPPKEGPKVCSMFLCRDLHIRRFSVERLD